MVADLSISTPLTNVEVLMWTEIEPKHLSHSQTKHVEKSVTGNYAVMLGIYAVMLGNYDVDISCFLKFPKKPLKSSKILVTAGKT